MPEDELDPDVMEALSFTGGTEDDLDPDVAAALGEGGPPAPTAEPASSWLDTPELVGAQQGVTAGFGEELAAGIETGGPLDIPGIGIEEVPRTVGRGLGAEVDPRTDYERVRDEERERIAGIQQEHPLRYGAGEFLGALATVPATGAGASRAVGALAPKLSGRAATGTAAVLEGTAMGGLEAAGTSDAETLGGVVEDVGSGALTGAGITTGMLGAGQAAKRFLGSRVGESAARQQKADMAKLAQAGKSISQAGRLGERGIAREARDIRELAAMGGAGRIPQTSGELMSSLTKGFEEAQGQLNRIKDAAADAGAIINGSKAAQEIRQVAQDLSANPFAAEEAEKVMQFADRVDTIVDLKTAATLRDELHGELSKLGRDAEAGQIYHLFRDEMQRGVEKALGPQEAADWSRLNKLVSAGIDGSSDALKAAYKDAKRRMPTFFPAMGAATSEPGDLVRSGLVGGVTGVVAREAGDRWQGLRSAYHQALASSDAPESAARFLDPGRMTQAVSREAAEPETAAEKREDLIGMLVQQSRIPEVQQSASAILSAQAQGNHAGAVEYYKQVNTNPALREELEEEERNGTYSR